HSNEDLTILGQMMLDNLKHEGLLVNGDKVVITVGDGQFFKQGTTNSIRVELIKDVPKALKSMDQDSIQEVSFDRGKFLLDTSICASCQTCISICPFDIYGVSEEHNRETRVKVENVNRCRLDMACVESCPTGAIEIIPKET